MIFNFTKFLISLHRMTDFIVYKLKETGKINEDDISAAMKGYEDHVYKQEKKIQD